MKEEENNRRESVSELTGAISLQRGMFFGNKFKSKSWCLVCLWLSNDNKQQRARVMGLCETTRSATPKSGRSPAAHEKNVHERGEGEQMRKSKGRAGECECRTLSDLVLHFLEECLGYPC